MNELLNKETVKRVEKALKKFDTNLKKCYINELMGHPVHCFILLKWSKKDIKNLLQIVL